MQFTLVKVKSENDKNQEELIFSPILVSPSAFS